MEAVVSLHPLRPDLQVFMIGEGPDRPLVESAIQANNAASYIHALPGCAFDDVAVWMAASNLVTLPSYMEGFPSVVLEALACGRPVVATNVGGIPEILSNEYGGLVPSREPLRGSVRLHRSSTETGTLWPFPLVEAEAGARCVRTARDLRITCIHSSGTYSIICRSTVSTTAHGRPKRSSQFAARVPPEEEEFFHSQWKTTSTILGLSFPHFLRLNDEIWRSVLLLGHLYRPRALEHRLLKP